MTSSAQVSLTYHPQVLSEFRNNPLIEVLPPPPSSDAAVRAALDRAPAFSEDERGLDNAQRRLMCGRLKRDFFVTSMQHVSMAYRITELIPAGYLGRNPLQAKGRGLQHGFGEGAAESALSMLISLSGSGKTTTVSNILTGLIGPQQILHTLYQGVPFHQMQVPYLKVICPASGDIKHFFKAAIDAVDDVAGTNYWELECDLRSPPGELQQVMEQALRAQNVGLFWMDECQNLALGLGSDRDRLVETVVQLRETVKVPILLSGTYRAAKMFDGVLAAGRRAVEGGYLELNRPAGPEDVRWREFCEQMWRYQWVRKPGPLDEPIIATLWELSQGVPGIVLPLFIQAQKAAIDLQIERVTAGLLKRVYRELFVPVHAALNALRSGPKGSGIERYEDLLPKKTFDWKSGDNEGLRGRKPKDAP